MYQDGQTYDDRLFITISTKTEIFSVILVSGIETWDRLRDTPNSVMRFIRRKRALFKR
jgi:hypothetical protein